MSTEKTAPRNAPVQSAESGLTIEDLAESAKPTVKKVEVTALQIDESYDVDCDPYNCTGQFLVDAARLKQDD